MNTTNRKTILLGTAVLGLSTTFGIANPSLAAPRDRDDRREVKQARKEVKRERKDVRRADTPEERRRERRDVREAREDLRDDRREAHQDNGRGRFNHRGRADNRPTWNDRSNSYPTYGTGRNYDNSRGYNGGQSFTGTVTRVRSNESFDINVNGNTYNVYLDFSTPRALSVGDIVRVIGVRQDKNDIRNARVSVMRNR